MKPDLFHSDLMLAPAVDARVPYSRAHLYRLEPRGEFPKRRRIGRHRIPWLPAEVEQWLSDKMEVQS